MRTQRERNISVAMDQTVATLDILNQLDAEHAAASGLTMVRGWKASLERALINQAQDGDHADDRSNP